MISEFLALLDGLLKLVNHRKLEREETFNQVIEPLFVELAPVVEDYFALLKEARDLLFAGALSIEPAGHYTAARELLMNRRDELLTTRIKVRGGAEALAAAASDDDLVSFSQAVIDLFHFSDIRDSAGSSGPRYVIELFDQMHRDTLTEEEAACAVDESIDRLEYRWKELMVMYAGLRLKLLHPNI